MTRREFSLAAAAAPASAAQSSKIRIAFLGMSHSHAEGKLAVVKANPAFELAGVWDSQGKGQTRSKADILGDKSIQAIACEGFVWENAGLALEALEAGKHVHLEKPPSETLAEFRKIQSIASRKKLLVQLGYMWRYNPAINEAFRLAKSGALGDLYAVRAQMNTIANAEQRKAWGRFRGGDMFEQGSHLIDMLVRLMGKPTRVTSTLQTHAQPADGFKDNTMAVLEWPRIIGTIHAATLQPNATAHRFLEILGTKGTAYVKPLEPPVLVTDIGGKTARTEYKYQRYVDDFVELAGCIAGGKPLSVTPEQDLWATEALLAACGQ